MQTLFILIVCRKKCPAARRESEGYKPEVQSKYLDMYIWMDKVSEIQNIKISHKLNSGKEHYIMGFFVDGVHKRDLYEYHGSKLHGSEKTVERMQHANRQRFFCLLQSQRH